MSSFALVVHGHFYQPPRENPWSDSIDDEPSAAPFHDWNARIHAECYRANAFARIHDGGGRIQSIVNNYSRMSYNFGPTLARWIERNDSRAHAALQAADGAQRRRLGFGGAMAQAYAHPIVPLSAPADRHTQLTWGLADFRRRFGRPAEGLWLPETAANVATLATLIDLGVRFTILAPEQVAAVRAPGVGEEWTSVDRDTVDTGRAYKWMHPDGSGRFLNIAVFDGPLSRGVAFGDATRDAATFMAMARASAARSRVSEPPLVLCASDGELFGHHKKFADLNLAFTTFVEGPRSGVNPTNLSAYLNAHPPTWEMMLAQGPDGKGTSWSCAHGVGRWWRDCGCTMVAQERGWNQRWRTPLREALDHLQREAAAFYEHAAAELVVDPWGARDAYGEVVDAPLAERDAHMAEFGTERLLRGGPEARARLRSLLELQRATLLMYASCGWYFDDIAGLEASLILRFAAHAVDLMKVAGGTPPLEAMLDTLAQAKSNERPRETGADVFRLGAGDRITPERVVATVALALTAGPDTALVHELTPGHHVQLLSHSTSGDGHRMELRGRAHLTVERTGDERDASFIARWDENGGVQVSVDGVDVPPGALARDSRHRVFPLLLPGLLAARKTAPVAAARLALELGRDLVGSGAPAADASLRHGFAQLLVALVGASGPLGSGVGDLASALFDAAGNAVGHGTIERSLTEELVAERLQKRSSRAIWCAFAEKLGFSTSEETNPEGAAAAAPLPEPS